MRRWKKENNEPGCSTINLEFLRSSHLAFPFALASHQIQKKDDSDVVAQNTNHHTSTMSKTFLITGANSGLGLDSTRQLALREDVKKIYMACRSQEKAEKAIEGLVADAGVSKDKLEFIKFDGSASKADVEAAIAGSLPKDVVLDGVVLNAGGAGNDTTGKPSGPNNVIPIIQINLVAHVHLIDFLVKKGHFRLNNNNKANKSRVIYVGTEGSRGVDLIGMKAPEFSESTVEYFKTYLDGSAYSKTKYDGMNVAYPDAKGIATFYMAAWARAHPDLFVLTVSPGGTKGTAFAADESIPFVLQKIFPIFMWVMGKLGKFHELPVGAKRYVDAVTGEGEFEAFTTSGAFIASKSGVTGPVSDQVETFETAKQYGDVAKQDAVFKAVNEYL